MPSSSFITDYSDSILINRSVVEDLNATIKVCAESNLSECFTSKNDQMLILLFFVCVRYKFIRWSIKKLQIHIPIFFASFIFGISKIDLYS